MPNINVDLSFSFTPRSGFTFPLQVKFVASYNPDTMGYIVATPEHYRVLTSASAVTIEMTIVRPSGEAVMDDYLVQAYIQNQDGEWVESLPQVTEDIPESVVASFDGVQCGIK
jgi:hypothetical protein